MTKLFWDHLTNHSDLLKELDNLGLDPDSKLEIFELVGSHIEHHTLDIIFTHLPAPKHEEFLRAFKVSPHDQALLSFLKKEISSDIESLIKQRVAKAKQEILSEIKKTSYKKK